MLFTHLVLRFQWYRASRRYSTQIGAILLNLLFRLVYLHIPYWALLEHTVSNLSHCGHCTSIHITRCQLHSTLSSTTIPYIWLHCLKVYRAGPGNSIRIVHKYNVIIFHWYCCSKFHNAVCYMALWWARLYVSSLPDAILTYLYRTIITLCNYVI